MFIFKFSKLTRDALTAAASILAIAETIMTVTGITMKDLLPGQTWWFLVLVLFAVFVLMVLSIRTILRLLSKRNISIDINGNTVNIVEGNLFAFNGLKVIPFNEYFDTKVDDCIIAHKSLNGIFVDDYAGDLQELERVIRTVENTSLKAPVQINGRLVYELGTVKRFKHEYLLLAFTHFNEQNEAHLSMPEYEKCLFNMWRELSRTYATNPIALPLLGSGITRFDDLPHKSPNELLGCMLCTLKTTRIEFNAPITIVLSKPAMRQVNLYKMKEAFGYGV